MPKNPEKFTSPDQSKKTGKLTPEEIKEMVKKFKEEHEGLLPEYFSLPGEEKEEKREYPEELLDYYEIKEKFKKELKEIEEGLRNETLRKNAIEEILSSISLNQKGNETEFWWGTCGYPFFLREFNEVKGKYLKEIEQGLKNESLRKNMIKWILSAVQAGQEGEKWAADFAFRGYSSLLSYPEFNEIKEKYSNEIDQIEKGFKNETLIKNMIEKTLSDLQEGQKEGKTGSAWNAFRGYSFLLSYLSHLYKIGQKKLAEMESQKAMYPEKKKLPPMPEEKAF
jgi:predicted DNA-binding transcriptional regulator